MLFTTSNKLSRKSGLLSVTKLLQQGGGYFASCESASCESEIEHFIKQI